MGPGAADLDTMTLADVVTGNPIKIITLKSLGDAGDSVVIIPSTAIAGNKVTLDAVGEGVTYQWDGLRWVVIGAHPTAAVS